jgi:hypothetical protein
VLAVQGPAATLDESFRAALGAARLTTQSARFDPSILPFYRQGEFQTPLYEAAYQDPWRAPFLFSSSRRLLSVSAERPAESLGVLSRLLGDGASRDFLGNPIQPTIEKTGRPGSLTAALERMKREGFFTGQIPSEAQVPEEVKRAAALIIEASLDAYSYRQAAFANAPEAAAAFSTEITQPLLSDNASAYQRRVAMARKVEMSYLYAAAQEISTAAVEARKIIGAVGRAIDYRFTVETAWGVISLSSRSVSEHGAKPIFVSIDTGGDDVYINASSNRSYQNWVSVVIDTHGRDSYLSHADLKTTQIEDWSGRNLAPKSMGPGGAAFGVAVLVDSDGSDLYRSALPGLGSALFGASYLLDTQGNDVYDSYRDSQGFARFGIGILEDSEGSDSYSGFHQVQGCGSVRGAGAILDRRGDDVYLANNKVIDFPSAQTKEANLSFSQGAGVGSRADYLNGRSLAGGIGILLDQGGSDQYSAGVFAQGAGYWMGIGALWDDEGGDKYRSVWFGQGVAAHFAVGHLEDRGGADEYFGQKFYFLGAGHDFGLGIFTDSGGGDIYTAGTLSGGSASENGIGIFVDTFGRDTYELGGISLGYTAEITPGTMRERALSMGVFIDLEGVDDYRNSASWARNGVQSVNWRTQRSLPSESQLGIFWDK